MTTLWTVVVLLALLMMANSVALIALTRQVGLLHLRSAPSEPGPASPATPPPLGPPEPGTRLRLDPAALAPATADPEPGLTLLGFVRPSCGGCGAALPAFAAVAAGLPGDERVVLVSDGDETVTRNFLATRGIGLPLVTGPHLLSANGIPAVPYTVVTDGEGTVLATGNAAGAAQLTALLARARASRPVPSSLP